jgi:cell division protein FtsI (penicillin-binding protein 3)
MDLRNPVLAAAQAGKRALPKRFRRRLFLATLGLAGWAALVVLRLVQLQVFETDKFSKLARRQHERTIALNPVRGTIYDHQLRELAVSVDLPSIYAVPAQIHSPRQAAQRLAPILELQPARLERLLESDRPFVWLKRKAPPELRQRIDNLGIDGLGSLTESGRFYPNFELAAHVVGFVGMDNIGLGGLEYSYDRDVRGTPGTALAWVDARRRRFAIEPRIPPRQGRSLVLTLDLPFQFLCEQALERALATTHAQAGSVIVIDPASGGILALANRPAYDPNHFNEFSTQLRIDRAIEDYYEPGSTFKVIVAAAALEDRVASPDQTFFCGNGSIRLPSGQVVHDHKPFGTLTFRQVLSKSSNVGIIQVAQLVGPEPLYHQILRNGFGKRTGIRLPGENPGVVPNPANWSGRTIGAIPMGQEVGVTPLQLLLAIASIANGGLQPQPRIVERMLDESGISVAVEPQGPMERSLSSATAATLTEMLEGVVLDGTGKRAAVPGYRLAGKTGTAQKIGETGGYEKGRYVASFTGFGPLPQPRFAAIVVLYEPEGAWYHGGDVAAPVFSEVAAAFLRLWRIPPTEPLPSSGART